MSVNQISPEYLWWTPHPHLLQPHHSDNNNDNNNPNSNSIAFSHRHNLNQSEDDETHHSRRHMNHQNQTMMEVMFEKPLTPSDVGKLNRLVIPKQHAERHFPLNANGGDSSASGGMLLSFEDEAGKFWRFRYSYWNSSQSYVLTKGWSRYVKEKRLDAGDVVLFQRHPSDPDRLFIACRRRTDPVQVPTPGKVNSPPPSFYPAHQVQAHLAHQQYRPDPESSSTAAAAAGAGGAVVVENKRATSSGGGGSRTFRLFGVNMEYHQFESDQSEPVTPDGSSTSNHSHYQQQYATAQFYPHVSYGMTNHTMQQDGSQHRG